MSSFKSSSAGGGGRVIHQDFIARIRYSNNLPPPSIPPKLLDIPNTGLSSGQYTTPGFASRLAREQPLNIEADAELGMPLDLVGMPGIFEGDESAIQAPSEQPPIHPADKALLRPLAALSRSKVGDQPVSFLRRTEYISSSILRPGTGNPSPRPADRLRRPEKRPAPETDDSPTAIRRKIDHSFEAAAAILADPSAKLKHPLKKPGARIVDSFPLLPDLDAFPDTGAYVTVKFTNPPVHSGSTYDERLVTGLFKPVERSAEEEEALHAAAEAHARDPLNFPAPPPSTRYDFYLPKTATDAARFRARFDVDNPENSEDALYTASNESGPCFQFARLRTYDTVKEVEMDHRTKWDHELLLGFTGDDDIEGQKAAWYYPVLQRSTLRPQRQRKADLFGGREDEGPAPVAQLDVTVEDPSDETREMTLKHKEHPLGPPEEEEEHVEEAGEDDELRNGGDAEDDEEVGSPRERDGTPSDEDAEGDDE